jgi:hypothetical protein
MKNELIFDDVFAFVGKDGFFYVAQFYWLNQLENKFVWTVFPVDSRVRFQSAHDRNPDGLTPEAR